MLKQEIWTEIFPNIKIRVRFPGPGFVGGDTKYFYHRIVKENIRDLEADPKDERKGVNACVLLYHMLDWYCKTRQEKDAVYKQIPFSDVLESIANGTKHANPNKKYKTYINSEHKLMVFENEQDIELLDVIKSIEAFWDKKLGKRYIAVYDEEAKGFI